MGGQSGKEDGIGGREAEKLEKRKEGRQQYVPKRGVCRMVSGPVPIESVYGFDF